MTSHPFRNNLVPQYENSKTLSNKTLVVGDLNRWQAQGRITPALQEFTFIDLAALDAARLAVLQPDIILSPLFCDDFDVVDVATRLVELGFTGRYRAIWCAVPDARIIWNEVSRQAPGLDFDLLLMPTA